ATIPLLPGSLAIDAGATIDGLTTDQRSIARPQGSAPDIGAFELVPSQAASIPIIGPLSGTYQDSVQVSITSTSANTTVRYTLDGSTPSTSHGQIYTGPLTFVRDANIKAIAYGPGWLSSPVASANYSVLPPLAYWRNLQGLAADGSQDLATPAGDGVANFLKYAFNLAPNAGDLAKPNATTLATNGTAGLPRVGYDGQGRLVIEFVRRKASTDPGIAYVVETGPDLMTWTTLSLTNATVTSIDNVWERVSVTDSTVAAKRFGRVRVLGLGVYFNDFNSGLGAATLRGSAELSNGAVKLTDENTGGAAGAVIFNGIAADSHVSGFTARLNLALGPIASGVPADGANFAIGDLGSAAWWESGPPTARNVSVGFDTYESGGNGSIGIHLWVNGVHLAANSTNPYTNGALVPVEITYDAGAITVKFNGATIFNNLAVPGFSIQGGDQFGISARTGGSAERATVDDVEIALR
ncbi:MAG TPA: chitobiase/beta-hexosaminidase C-terminal domain-containing protein, partial [Chthoniobacterales bacterium]